MGDNLGEHEGPPGLLTGGGESSLMGDPGGLLVPPPLPDGTGEPLGNGSILGTDGAGEPPFTLASLLLRDGL